MICKLINNCHGFLLFSILGPQYELGQVERWQFSQHQHPSVIHLIFDPGLSSSDQRGRWWGSYTVRTITWPQSLISFDQKLLASFIVLTTTHFVGSGTISIFHNLLVVSGKLLVSVWALYKCWRLTVGFSHESIDQPVNASRSSRPLFSLPILRPFTAGIIWAVYQITSEIKADDSIPGIWKWNVIE